MSPFHLARQTENSECAKVTFGEGTSESKLPLPKKLSRTRLAYLLLATGIFHSGCRTTDDRTPFVVAGPANVIPKSG